MPTAFELLREAIQNRKQVIAYYQGKRREMCPHVLGYKDGRERCLFYQFAGESSKGIFPTQDPRARQNWRCLFLDEISNIELRDGQWHSISWHSKRQTCIDRVEIQVAGWM